MAKTYIGGGVEVEVVGNLIEISVTDHSIVLDRTSQLNLIDFIIKARHGTHHSLGGGTTAGISHTEVTANLDNKD